MHSIVLLSCHFLLLVIIHFFSQELTCMYMQCLLLQLKLLLCVLSMHNVCVCVRHCLQVSKMYKQLTSIPIIM